MAITFREAGTWAAVGSTSPLTITMPASATTTDMMYAIAVWKDHTVTATATAGWNEVTQFTDGTVDTGSNIGSVTVGVWAKEHDGSESNPAITFSATPVTRTGVVVAFARGGGDVWDTPTFVSAPITTWTTSSQTESATSTISVRHDGLVVGIAGIRDDTATFTRPTTGIDASGVTWNGNYVEAPATHASSTTGNDIAADAGYRLVTIGGFAKTLTQTATLSAAETGAALWIVQGLVGAGPTNTTVTPTTLALTIAPFAPTVTATSNQLVTPTTLALTTTGFAPVLDLAIIPPTLALTLAPFAPTVTVAAGGITVTPTTAALTLTTFEPTVATPALATPTTVALTLTTFAPAVSTPVLATPTTAALTLATFAPTVTAHALATPTAASLALATFAPTVTATAHVTATPTTVALTLTTFAPSVGQPASVTPTTASLTLTTFAPTLTTSDNLLVTPGTVALTLATFAPDVTGVAPFLATPTTAALILTTYVPEVFGGGPIDFIDGELVVSDPVRGRLVVTTPRYDGEIEAA